MRVEEGGKGKEEERRGRKGRGRKEKKRTLYDKLLVRVIF